MKCMLCGTENRDEAIRCKGCGASLSASPKRPLGRAPAPTVLEGAPPSAPSAAAPPAMGGPRKTRIATADEVSAASAMAQRAPGSHVPLSTGAAAHGKGRKTVYLPPEDAPAGTAGTEPGAVDRAVRTAKVVGFLVTFTWDPRGQWFVLKEGRTVVGSESGCDVHIPSDRALSGKHFAVQYRRGKVRVRDLDSTNATRVDDEEIWGDSVACGHGTIIQAGDTTFELVMIPSRLGDV